MSKIGGSNRVISMHDAAEYLGVSYKHMQRMYKTWGIPHHRVGRLVNFRERDLETYLERVRQ